MKRLYIDINEKFRVGGDGMWSDTAKEVFVERFFLYVYEEGGLEGYGHLRAEFDNNDWDIDRDGLIYTDSVFQEQVNAKMKELGFIMTASYSEQGMQGRDYVDFDIEDERNELETWERTQARKKKLDRIFG